MTVHSAVVATASAALDDNFTITEPLYMGQGTGQVSSHNTETHALFIRALLMLSLILISMNINGLLHRLKFHYLSETAVTILLGLVVAMGWTAISYDETNADIQLSSNFFYMVLLPPIIFEGGYTLQRVSFFSNFFTIFALAFAGALYSTFICSVMMYFFSKIIFPWSFVESLVFGSLISSTDPVTVLSLLPSSVDRRLYMLIFGESALNDAVAIILYRFFTGLADPKMRLGVGPFFVSVFASAGVFIGSFIVGVTLALIFAKITKHMDMAENSTVFEMTMMLVFAYSSYLLADVLQLTGIISIFFCGITMAHYASGNLSDDARRQSRTTLRVIAFMCECFIFLYLGLGLLSFGGQATYDPAMILFACISILVSRTHVFIILGIKNMLIKTDVPIPWNQQVLIWFSGLRGAVAFALGVTFLEHPVFDADVKGYIFGTTVMVVVLTVLVLGGLTPYMLVWLGLAPAHGSEEEAAAGGHGKESKEHAALADEEGKAGGEGEGEGHEASATANKEAEKKSQSINSLLGDEEEQRHEAETKPVFGWLYNFDIMYIRPHFSKRAVNHQPTPDLLVPNALFPKSSNGDLVGTPSGNRSQSRKQSTASRKEFKGLDQEDLQVLVKKSASADRFDIE